MVPGEMLGRVLSVESPHETAGDRALVMEQQLPAAWLSLSRVEHQVALLLAQGADRREVAGALGCAVSTGDDHRIAVLRKLNLRSTVALARYALRHGLVSIEPSSFETGVSVTAKQARARAGVASKQQDIATVILQRRLATRHG